MLNTHATPLSPERFARPAQPACVEDRPTLLLGIGSPILAESIASTLAEAGYNTQRVEDQSGLQRALDEDSTQIFLLDLEMAGADGLSMIRRIAAREHGLLVFSRRPSESERIASLEMGADDHLPLPPSPRELVARLRVLMRRLRGADNLPAMQVAAGVHLDPARQRIVDADGTEIHLTGAEAGMLAMMLQTPGHLAERDAIAEQVLGYRRKPQQRGVDQFASSLRQKLEKASNGRIQVLAVRGRGYRLVW